MRENWIIIGSFLTNLFVILMVILLQGHFPPVVPLFYGKPQGEEQLVQSILLILPPLISILIITLNTILLSFLKNKFLQKILFGLIITITVLSTITVIEIILLVGSF